MEKFIANIKPLRQFMDDGSFLLPEIPPVLRALQTLGVPDYVDYDYLLCATGMAVRLAWQPGWAAYAALPNQAVFSDYDEGFKYTLRALDLVNAKYTVKPMSDEILPDIQNAIDRGKPVLLNEPFVATAVVGYKDDQLYGVSTFASDDGNNVNGCFPVDTTETKKYVIVEEASPKPVDKQFLADTFKRAIYLAFTTTSTIHPNASFGIAAFDGLAEMMVWDESFEIFDDDTLASDKPVRFPYKRPDGYWCDDGAHSLSDRFWAGYCDFLCMLNGYDNMARFLRKYADVVPEWHDAMIEAADNYKTACDYSGALWNYVSPDEAGLKKFRTSEVRYTFAAHMLRAKIYTKRAAETLQSIVE